MYKAPEKTVTALHILFKTKTAPCGFGRGRNPKLNDRQKAQVQDWAKAFPRNAHKRSVLEILKDLDNIGIIDKV